MFSFLTSVTFRNPPNTSASHEHLVTEEAGDFFGNYNEYKQNDFGMDDEGTMNSGAGPVRMCLPMYT
jgi:hypothetical protein